MMIKSTLSTRKQKRLSTDHFEENLMTLKSFRKLTREENDQDCGGRIELHHVLSCGTTLCSGVARSWLVCQYIILLCTLNL